MGGTRDNCVNVYVAPMARSKTFMVLRVSGAGLDVLWPEGLALFGLATVILTFARLRYRVRLG